MSFVTQRQRQQWLSQAEDYADVVSHEKRKFLRLKTRSFSFYKKQNTFCRTSLVSA